VTANGLVRPAYVALESPLWREFPDWRGGHRFSTLRSALL